MYKYMIVLTLLFSSSTIQAAPRNCSYNDYCNNCQGSNRAYWCNSCTSTYRCQPSVYYELPKIPRVVEFPSIPKEIPRIPNDPRCLSCPNPDIYIKPQIQRQW